MTLKDFLAGKLLSQNWIRVRPDGSKDTVLVARGFYRRLTVDRVEVFLPYSQFTGTEIIQAWKN